jgi:NADH dehydrogenase
VLDRSNYHGFWPLLYQVATAGLEPESIAYPIRAILRHYPNVDFQLAEVHNINFKHKKVLTDGEAVPYDYLVLAAGSTNSFFGNDNLATYTYGLKDLDEAVKLRNRILVSFEMASRESDPAKKAALLTFVIVGGGPTGVELAGAFSELIVHVLRKDYHNLDTMQARVILIEASPNLLATFPENLQHTAYKQLEKMGIEIQLKTAVANVSNNVVTLKGGEEIAAATVIWAAGVQASPLATQLQRPLGRQGRVPVTPTLNLEDYPEVFVIGDMAYLEGYKNKQAYPMVAQVAIQMGKQAAANIVANIEQQPLQPFKYKDKGTMATIGRKAAVMDAYGIKLSGLLAWVSWLFVHLVYLIGFRNRLIVLANWAYNYFTYDRGTRLISGRKGEW